ncbi:cache domain-containing sensor histidine kinase [Paenibacillus roseipurpureus]|uniref:Sensor histidine kinase n=1 Tax=Paenibacillus roseopurpureus TaxID=2918901 RepID=A0AA96RM41_9BACL|nr:sensor histidine kinase [Paenibacillus sp. MBLB1832]WNR46069.1 sensor histidine kinase [Paenibacillus sp. MBLB1832]
MEAKELKVRSFLSFLRTSFYVKMILIMLLVSVIPLITLSFLAISLFERTFERQLNHANYQVVNQVTERINVITDRMQQISFQYAVMPTINNALSPYKSVFDGIEKMKELLATFDTGLPIIGDADAYVLYRHTDSSLLATNEAVTSLDNSRYRNIVTDFIEKGKSFVLDNVDKLQVDPVLLKDHSYFLRRIPTDPTKELSGVLIISVHNQTFNKLIQQIQIGPKSTFWITTPDGNVVAASQDNKPAYIDRKQHMKSIIQVWEENGRPEYFFNGDHILAIQQSAGQFPWLVISEVPTDELLSSSRTIRSTLFISLTLLITIGLFSIFFFGYYLYRPLQRIKLHINGFKLGDFSRRLPVQNRNEIGDLAMLLNTMAARMQDLITELKETEQAKRKQEIRALQSQINPHFLYNSLNSINMLAMMKDYSTIREMMNSLVSLLRYSMEHMEQSVPLQMELDYLQKYVRTMQIRYRNNFRLECVIEPKLQAMKVPKLMLQPLIENAIQHGILAKEDLSGGIITISAAYWQGSQRIILTISDNGAGMSDSRLSEIQALLQQQGNDDNIGLKNVSDRVRLVFGSEASFTIDSTPGTGSVIRIILPEEEIAYEEEQGDDEVL